MQYTECFFFFNFLWGLIHSIGRCLGVDILNKVQVWFLIHYSYSGGTCLKPFCCCRIGNGGRGRSSELIGCGTHVCSFGQWMKQGCNWGNKTRCMGRGKFALGLVWGCDVSPQCAAGGKKRKRKKEKSKKETPSSKKWSQISRGKVGQEFSGVWLKGWEVNLAAFPLRFANVSSQD